MAMRLTALLWLVAVVAGAEDTWSGVIHVIDEVRTRPAPARRAAELEAMIADWRRRLAGIDSRMVAAGRLERRLLREDLAVLEDAIRAAGLERGGNQTLARRTWHLDRVPFDRAAMVDSDCRLLITERRLRLVADRGTGATLGCDAWDSRLTARVLVPPPPVAAGSVVIEDLLELPTRRLVLVIEGAEATIDWTPAVPNPYAVALDRDQVEGSMTHTLARVPGLPLRISRPLEAGFVLTRVLRVEPGPVDPERFILPDYAMDDE